MSGAPPSIGVVIPTRDRPELLRAAIDGVLSQDYDGPIRVVIVYDGTTPDQSLASSAVEVMTNSRRPGLAGARNTGIAALDRILGENAAPDNAENAGNALVAFCDDDDQWLPGKLAAQVDALQAKPGARFCTCSIMVAFDGHTSPRLAGTDTVPQEQLLRSRMAMLHSSTFLFRRSLLEDIGFVDEEIPGGQNEDWDLLLRASAELPIVHVDRPLVRVRWGRTSFFSRQWESKIESLEWMLRRHAGIGRHRVGAARVYGQLGFAYACLGDGRNARRWAVRALRRHWREWRGVVALLVTTRLVSGETVLKVLHRYGRGV